MTEVVEPEKIAVKEVPKGKVTITDDAQVMYQADATNPLPGLCVGVLKPGEHVLDLNFEPAVGVEFDGQLLAEHINAVLAPLTALVDVADASVAVQDIAAGLRNGLGIVARADYAEQIKALDDSMRGVLRSKGVRFGPLYIFCYDLNKPAAVRLRGLLYALHAGMALPAPVPADGMVSKAVDLLSLERHSGTEAELRGFYTAIGYPVYGARCIRIDMLDRVVNLVYESADKGKFKAQHAMAEWLGCGIADLYAVLEGLGHKKVYDPVDEAVAEVVAASGEDEVAKPEVPKTADGKPELATFALKAGKAVGSRVVPKKANKPADQQPKRDKAKGKSNKGRGKEPRVMSAEAAPAAAEDSPWAVLAQLKE